jgi:8-oxo-dGTP pyrophosphatase MutT (NUDIX family)
VTGLHADAIAEFERWQPKTPDQESLRQAFLSYLAARDDACWRSCAPGHLTASAVVLDATGQNVLLTLHPRVGAWIQLGGHCEAGDDTLAGAALREAVEESGIADLRMEPGLAHVDVLPVTCSLGVPTRHFDLRYVMHAPPGAKPLRSNESIDLRWWPADELPNPYMTAMLDHIRR